MRQLTNNLVKLIVALLLGLSPLQGAIASMLDTHSNDMAIHQMMGGELDVSNAFLNSMHQDCPQQMTDGGCKMHIGASGHCASYAVAMLSATTNAFTPLFESSSLPSRERFSSQYTTALYRPPRV